MCSIVAITDVSSTLIRRSEIIMPSWFHSDERSWKLLVFIITSVASRQSQSVFSTGGLRTELTAAAKSELRFWWLKDSRLSNFPLELTLVRRYAGPRGALLLRHCPPLSARISRSAHKVGVGEMGASTWCGGCLPSQVRGSEPRYFGNRSMRPSRDHRSGLQ